MTIASRHSALLVLLLIPGCSLGAFGLAETDRIGDAAGGRVDPPAEDAAIGSAKKDAAIGSGHVADAGAHRDSGLRDSSAIDAETAIDATSATDGASALPPILGAWSFDEGIGFASADLSGNGHPAAFVGGAWWGSGKSGFGLALDGMSGYADIGVAIVDRTKSFSILVWAQLSSIDSWETAVSEDGVTGSIFGLKLRGDGTHTFDFDLETSDVTNPGFIVAQSTSTARAQEWVHLASVYDAAGKGAAKLYVNGILESLTSVVPPIAATATRFVMGRGLYDGVAGSYLCGAIDEVTVYDGALSETQIAALYATYQ